MVKVTKGAPQVILPLCANPPDVESEVEKAANEFAHRGFRSLGIARADDNAQWKFVGAMGVADLGLRPRAVLGK
jgi:H+-transporting ATPase